MSNQQAIHKFVLGNKELEGKSAEFQYDKGWYSITDIIGEERNVIYKSKNAQEAYMKWNVYIGRKKERPVPEDRKKAEPAREHKDNRENHDNRENRERRDNHKEYRENREFTKGSREHKRDNNRNRSRNRNNREKRPQ